jgi:hypothetical protein
VRARIQASPVEAVSLMVSESAATQLLVMISEQPRLCARPNPGINSGGSLVDYF